MNLKEHVLEELVSTSDAFKNLSFVAGAVIPTYSRRLRQALAKEDKDWETNSQTQHVCFFRASILVGPSRSTSPLEHPKAFFAS